MHIAIDIDGTISANPEFFWNFISALDDCSEITILTGSIGEVGNNINPPNRVEQLIDLFGKPTPHKIVQVKRENVTDVATGKGEYCRDNNVDALFEDTELYIQKVKEISPRTVCFLIK